MCHGNEGVRLCQRNDGVRVCQRSESVPGSEGVSGE